MLISAYTTRATTSLIMNVNAHQSVLYVHRLSFNHASTHIQSCVRARSYLLEMCKHDFQKLSKLAPGPLQD